MSPETGVGSLGRAGMSNVNGAGLFEFSLVQEVLSGDCSLFEPVIGEVGVASGRFAVGRIKGEGSPSEGTSFSSTAGEVSGMGA